LSDALKGFDEQKALMLSSLERLRLKCLHVQPAALFFPHPHPLLLTRGETDDILSMSAANVTPGAAGSKKRGDAGSTFFPFLTFLLTLV
jgi:hypothetical protein